MLFADGTVQVRNDFHWWDGQLAGAEPDVDFGVNWTADGKKYPRWRLSWRPGCGVLYAKEQATAERGRFAVLGRFKTRAEVESALAEWADGPMTLEWVWERTSSTLPEEPAGVEPSPAKSVCPESEDGEHNPTFERVDDDEMMVVECFECGVEGRIKLRDVFAQYPVMWEEI